MFGWRLESNMSLPHIQFYVGDWRKDLGIQTLSYYHRGIWFELLMLMHCAEERGRLVLAGKPMSNAALARLLGLSQQETQDALAAILDSGVASKDEAEVFFCRRMVREEELRQNRKRAGSKGGSKTGSKREATPFDLLSHVPFSSSPPHTPPLTPHPSTSTIANALEKVRDFAKSEHISQDDADWFFYKGEGNGWTNGGKPILDWKATLRSWKRAGYLPSQRQSSNGQRQFVSRPKEKAPSYEKISPPRDLTSTEEAEAENARRIAREETEKFRKQLAT